MQIAACSGWLVRELNKLGRTGFGDASVAEPDLKKKIRSQFWALRRRAGKARKRDEYLHIPRFRNPAGRDASVLKM
jgi:hypothetical protein